MSIFFWKKNKSIDIFANELANDFYSYVQPKLVKDYFQSALIKGKEGKKNKKVVEDNLQSLVKQIQQYRVTGNLGTYGKARFQLKFDERLRELGYDKETVTKLSEFVLIKAQ